MPGLRATAATSSRTSPPPRSACSQAQRLALPCPAMRATAPRARDSSSGSPSISSRPSKNASGAGTTWAAGSSFRSHTQRGNV